MNITLYGVRGSYPLTDSNVQRYGGNTTSVRVDVGEPLIFDAGTGIRRLGLELAEQKANMFFSHYHQDHIEGLRTFDKIHDPKMELAMWGATHGQTLESLVGQQMQGYHFPLSLAQTAAKKSYHSLVPGQIVKLQNAEVEAVQLSHPGGSIGYIVRSNEGIAGLIWDHEPGIDEQVDRNLKEKLRGSNVIIIDAAYSKQEHAKKKGWGHGTNIDAANLGRELGATIYLTHHDPAHSDSDVDALVQEARAIHPNTHGAYEGLRITLGGK